MLWLVQTDFTKASSLFWKRARFLESVYLWPLTFGKASSLLKASKLFSFVKHCELAVKASLPKQPITNVKASSLWKLARFLVKWSPDYELRKDTLTGELWGVFSGFIGEKIQWQWDMESALYHAECTTSHWRKLWDVLTYPCLNLGLTMWQRPLKCK